MDWCPRSREDYLVVPKDQDLSEKVPSSPGIWSKWGVYAPESFVSPNNFYGSDMSLTVDEFNFNRFCNEVEVDIPVQDKDHCSGSSLCGGSLEESLQRSSVSCSRADSELDPLAGIDHLDDIFLSSLLEDLPRDEDSPKLFDVLPANNLVTDMSLDSKDNSSDKHSIGSSKYLQTHAFSPSADWEEGEAATSPFIPCKSEQKCLQPLKAQRVKPQIPSEESTASEPVSKETSLEESVLQELTMVLSQMTEKTRMCFRDALYRLAESSKQHVIILRQGGDFAAETLLGTGHDIHTRAGEKKAVESETNLVDRTIANLMFNKMDLNVRDFPVPAQIKPKKKVISSTGSKNDSSEQQQIHHFYQAMFADNGPDAEVPTLS